MKAARPRVERHLSLNPHAAAFWRGRSYSGAVRGAEAPGTRETMAAWGAIWFAVAGSAGFLSLLLPDTAVDDRTLLLAVSIASLAVALTLSVVYDRLPVAGFHVAVVAGSAATGLAVYAWGPASSYAPLPYVWVTLFAFYFFTLPTALAHLGLAMAGYALALVAESPPGSHLDGWLATTGTLLAGGMFVLVVRDRMAAQLAGFADAARRDALTELLDRRGFEEVFDLELERARRAGTPLSLIVGDLDRFKRVNDEHGHPAGDEALRRVARTIRSCKRGFDLAARIGGEEFAVLAADSDAHGAYMLAERMRTQVTRNSYGLTVSFGIATFPLHGGSQEALLHAADQALYAAKRLGGNRTVISSAEVSGIVAGPPRSYEDRHVELAALLSLAEALDVRDSGSASHCHRVGRLAELTARELGLAPDAVERVRLAGILHDIGRVGIPDTLVRKPGPLTDEEWRLVREHPEIGARMVATTHSDDIRSWILFHHTRPDGRGYPVGHPWDQVPLEARILGAADAYEAITSDRPYRGALPVEDAATLLRDGAGRQFDAQVVDALLRAV
jgi:diguanylate cyclase (GGDEF)-like protein/putative nucleotidyltransferase with HDIG domain